MYPTAEKPQGFLRKYVFVAPSNPIDASIRSSWKRFRRAAFLINTVPVENRDGDTTFETMRRQRGISDADLARRERAVRNYARFNGFMMLLVPLWALWLGTWQAGVSCLGALILFGALWFKWSFRLWQIRQRRFGLPSEFLRGEWWIECI